MTSTKKSRRTINLANRSANLPFSDAVLVGDTLYISGRIGIDPATGVAPPDIGHERRILFDDFSRARGCWNALERPGVGADLFSRSYPLGPFQCRIRKAFSRRFSRPRFSGIGSAVAQRTIRDDGNFGGNE